MYTHVYTRVLVFLCFKIINCCIEIIVLQTFSDLKEKYQKRSKSIDDALDGLTLEWSNLEQQSTEKEKDLFEHHKNEILEKSAADLERYVLQFITIKI